MNVVVMRGINDDELCDFVELTRNAPLNVRFIEYMPFDGNVWSDSKMVPYAEMMAIVQERYSQGLERCRVSAANVRVSLVVKISGWEILLACVHAACMQKVVHFSGGEGWSIS